MKQIPSLDDIKPGQDIGIEIDESKSIDMFVKNLYKEKSVMFQEIYSNELTAAMKARELGAKPWIDVITNLDERKLIIHGCNSLGITPKIMIDVAMVLGASGNTDKDKPGMWGFGFAAWLGISNTMILSSLPMETKKQYDLIFVGSLGSKSIDSVDLEHTGTRIQLIVKPNVDMSDLIRHLVKCVQFSDIPTFLTNEVPLEGDLGGYESAGRQEIPSVTHAEYIEKLRLDNGSTAIPGTKIHIKDKSFEFTAIYNPTKDAKNHENGHKILTLNIPIQAKIELPDEIRASVLNITDATKLKPTPDRERLDDAAQKAINKKLPKLIDAELKKFNLTCLQDFIDTDNDCLYVDPKNDNMDLSWYDKKTKMFASEFFCKQSTTYLDKYYGTPLYSFAYEPLREYIGDKKLPIVLIPKYRPSAKNSSKAPGEKIKFNASEKRQNAWFAKVRERYPENIIMSFSLQERYETHLKYGHSEEDVIFAVDEVPRKFSR